MTQQAQAASVSEKKTEFKPTPVACVLRFFNVSRKSLSGHLQEGRDLVLYHAALDRIMAKRGILNCILSPVLFNECSSSDKNTFAGRFPAMIRSDIFISHGTHMI
jgi:hypothetical protein